MKRTLYSPILQLCFCLIGVGLISGCKQAPPLSIPNIRVLAPAQASPGEPVFVMGSWLQLTTGLSISGSGGTVTYGMGEFSVISDDSLLLLTPDLPPGPYLLKLYNAEDAESQSADIQIRAPRPIIQGFDSLCNFPGDTACIFGTQFSPDSLSISIGGVTISEIVSISESRICFTVPQGLPTNRIPAIVSTTAGLSNEWDFILCSQAIGAPEISSIEPDTVQIGDTLIINGLNFIPDSTQVGFTGTLTPSLPIEVDSIQLAVIVPQDARSGLLTLSTPYGSAPAQIVIIGDLKITKIIPASNPKGGPVLIFGKDLHQVTEVFIDGIPISQGGFGYFSQPNMIATNIPLSITGILPRISTVSVSAAGLNSPAYPFQLLNGISGNPPTGAGFQVSIPNYSSSTSVGGISNLWMTASYTSNGNVVEGEFVMQDFIDQLDSLFIIGDDFFDSAGYYNQNSQTLHILNAIGWIDTTYRPEVGRFILMPLSSGDQFELLYPKCGGIDSLSPSIASPGDTVSIIGWPFFKARYLPWATSGPAEGEFVVLFDCDEIGGLHENCTEIEAIELSIRELKFIVPAVSAGQYEIRVGSIYHTSNIVSLEIQ